jgi:hypothetical protein
MTNTWKITAPVTSFTGEVAGCAFAHGKFEGEASLGALQYFRGAGYTVERVEDQAPVEPETFETPVVEPPAKSAKKEDWVKFAVEHRQADPVEAEKLNRDELAAKYGPKGDEK